VLERFGGHAGPGIVDMLADRIVERVAARLAETLAPPSRPLVPFVVDDHAAGFLDAHRAARVASFDDVFATAEGSITFHRSLATPAARTEALSGVTRTLAAERALTGWRDERYRVPSSAAAPALFEIERAAARYFGIETHAAHVNGTTVRSDGTTGMWIARRSDAKPIDPGLLDNLVGGGVAADLSVMETVVKEAREEAGIPASLAELARPSGTVTIFREQPDGLQRETLHVYDLELPPAFTPRNEDGEVDDFRLASVDEVAVWIGDRDGPRVVTADASLVIVDWLLRHGHVTPAHAAFAALNALRVATLPPNAR
jgi:8-oxo-dGTP pyrophosphatase MutT (NUDIX family)